MQNPITCWSESHIIYTVTLRVVDSESTGEHVKAFPPVTDCCCRRFAIFIEDLTCTNGPCPAPPAAMIAEGFPDTLEWAGSVAAASVDWFFV
mmetsp:Transcript_123914/g.214814  ORF Transcript_123914/g.214814 Transcript_123914/m.214814 type:complete len:92 (+) Transcript_123914:39-314(+)